MQISPYWLQTMFPDGTSILIYTIIHTSHLQPTKYMTLHVESVYCTLSEERCTAVTGVWSAVSSKGDGSFFPKLSFLPSILSILMRVVSVLSYPHLPLMLHSSPFSASLPSPTSLRPLSNPPRTATRHPASHKSSLEPSQRTTAASCNGAKSECNHTERTEPLRQLAQPGK